MADPQGQHSATGGAREISRLPPPFPAEGHTAWRGLSDGLDGWSVTVDCDHHERILHVAIWSPHGSTDCSVPFERTVGLRDLLIEVHGLPDATDVQADGDG